MLNTIDMLLEEHGIKNLCMKCCNTGEYYNGKEIKHCKCKLTKNQESSNNAKLLYNS